LRNIEKSIEKKKKKKIFDALAMNCFQTINYLIDIGELAAKRVDKNTYFSTYADIFEVLKRKGIIDEDELRLISSLISYRNKISHQYHIVSERELMLMSFYCSQLSKVVKKMTSVAKS